MFQDWWKWDVCFKEQDIEPVFEFLWQAFSHYLYPYRWYHHILAAVVTVDPTVTQNPDIWNNRRITKTMFVTSICPVYKKIPYGSNEEEEKKTMAEAVKLHSNAVAATFRKAKQRRCMESVTTAAVGN